MEPIALNVTANVKVAITIPTISKHASYTFYGVMSPYPIVVIVVIAK